LRPLRPRRDASLPALRLSLLHVKSRVHHAPGGHAIQATTRSLTNINSCPASKLQYSWLASSGIRLQSLGLILSRVANEYGGWLTRPIKMGVKLQPTRIQGLVTPGDILLPHSPQPAPWRTLRNKSRSVCTRCNWSKTRVKFVNKLESEGKTITTNPSPSMNGKREPPGSGEVT